jgi:hypothetical protein
MMAFSVVYFTNALFLLADLRVKVRARTEMVLPLATLPGTF